jgi:multidrug efflux pump subunit AcrA (membrane-fusion protein)
MRGPRNTSGPRTSAHVAQDLAAAQVTLAAREEDVRDAASAYEAALDVGRDAALAARERLSDAEVDRDIARRAAEKLSTEHGLALEGERRAELAGVVGMADTAIATYREACERLLPEMGRMSRQLMRAWAEAEQANEAAEAALQQKLKAEGVKNASRCRPSVENFRMWPGRPSEVVGEPVEHELWVNAEGEAPAEEWQNRIRLQPNGTGVLHHHGPVVFAHRRRFREEQVVEAQTAKSVTALVRTLCVPGRTAFHQAGWEPVKFASASNVLTRLSELERPLDIAEDRRWPELRLVPVGLAWKVGESAPAFVPIGTQVASESEAQT